MDRFVSLFVQFGLLHHRIDASRAPGRLEDFGFSIQNRDRDSRSLLWMISASP
jgi:hypothetical protein